MYKKTIKTVLTSVAFLGLIACNSHKEKTPSTSSITTEVKPLQLTLEEAKKIIALPLHCLTVEYPNKLGQALGSEKDLKTPQQLRPIFYGCFDWHSSVHGYWSIVTLLEKFPDLDENNEIREKLNALITEENLATELAFFDDYNNRNFERTYGWAWFFQLHGQLSQWQDADAQRWAKILQPMADKFIERYTEYLPKLLYPSRTGTHDNSAFSLSLALQYARQMKNSTFEALIERHALRLYENDRNCNITFEPSGHDFLSACLEEANLMGQILDNAAYETWLTAFLPEITTTAFTLQPAKVSDRADGHLVHLDGLNFSRATCLKEIARKLPAVSEHLNQLANEHFEASFGNITNDDYMGSHWLGTFALYTLIHQ